jgi:geranylgeranyl diphosphate synthase, type I
MNPPAVLTRAAGLVEPVLRKVVGQLDPQLRIPAEFHFGWVDPDGTPARANNGKRVRPALAVLGAEAVGGDAEAAIPGAVALELIHNFSLIHDDIMDGDRMRRHRRTVWDVYGVADAILVGDALQTLAYDVLLGDPGPAHLAAARRLTAGTAAMITGQSQDGALDRADDVTQAQCMTMAANKTGALLAQSTAIGAVLGGAGEAPTTAALERFGAELGLSFQAVDDVLGVWGDPAVTGKPVGNDLRARKKSMPVALALAAGGELAAEVRRTFAAEMTDASVGRLATLLEAHGIRTQVDALAQTHLERALATLRSTSLVPAAGAELEELAGFIVHRTY